VSYLTAVNPIRHVAASTRTVTSSADILPGTWRYSSHLALVLSGGGARAAYQVGVLSELAERLPGLEFPILTGVSAGAINTAYIAANHNAFAARVAALRDEWLRLTADRIYCLHPAALAAAGIKVA